MGNIVGVMPHFKLKYNVVNLYFIKLKMSLMLGYSIFCSSKSQLINLITNQIEQTDLQNTSPRFSLIFYCSSLDRNPIFPKILKLSLISFFHTQYLVRLELLFLHLKFTQYPNTSHQVAALLVQGSFLVVLAVNVSCLELFYYWQVSYLLPSVPKIAAGVSPPTINQITPSFAPNSFIFVQIKKPKSPHQQPLEIKHLSFASDFSF